MRGISTLPKIAVAAILLASVTTLESGSMADSGRGSAVFVGADAGFPVAFSILNLPPVVVGSFNDPASLSPFEPSFAELTTGNTVIESLAQAQRIWRRLFAQPFDASSVDFNDQFIVLVGAGALVNSFLEITSVEQFTATFEDPFRFGGPVDEPKLAVISTLTIGGAHPDPKILPTFQLAAVAISRDVESDIIFHRALLPLP